MGSINSLIRDNVKRLKPYSSARDEYKGEAAVFLDANENPWFAPLNRYPDPMQMELKRKISAMRMVDTGNIFLGNGSDEAIDIITRVFCEPGSDNVVSIDPSYGMYEVTAAVNNIEFRKVKLGKGFSLDHEAIEKRSDDKTKLIFLCSPNNPTGNSFTVEDIEQIFAWYKGIIVMDEAYIDFSGHPGFLGEIGSHRRLVILQTLSKAWGRAGIRLGMAFGDKEVVSAMNKIKPPYNINTLTASEAMQTLLKENEKNARIAEIVSSRHLLAEKLAGLPAVKHVYPSDANFLLVKVDNADRLYQYLAGKQIIVRNRNNATGCENCIRITIGTESENRILLDAIDEYKK